MNLHFFKKNDGWNWPLLITIGIVVSIIIAIIVNKTTAFDIPCSVVKQGGFIIDVNVSGEIHAVKSTSIGVPRNMRHNTRIVDLVADGAMVKEGDFLVEFDKNEAIKAVEEQQQKLETVKAELISLKASIATQNVELETSYQSQLYSFEQAKLRHQQMKFEAKAKQREQEINFKKAQLTLEQAKKKIESQKTINYSKIQKAKMKIKHAEQRLQQRKDNVDKLTMTSPVNGLVVLNETWGSNGRAKFKIGDTPYRGVDILNIPDLSQMKIKAKLNEMFISQVKKGKSVMIDIDALTDKTFHGVVSYVAVLAKRKRGSHVKEFDLEITINDTANQLRPGMTAQCQIITDRFEDVLSAPIECVFTKRDTTVMYVKGRRFQEREVRVGPQNSDFVIVKDGVTAGERVALLDPTMQLEELDNKAASESKGGFNRQ